MTLENRMKIEGARGKNVRSSIFFNFLVKTLGGYFGAQKVDFDDSKSRNGYSPMDSSSFRGKNQNLSRSFHAYQIYPLLQPFYIFFTWLNVFLYFIELIHVQNVVKKNLVPKLCSK